MPHTSKLLKGFRNATFDDCLIFKDDSDNDNDNRPNASSKLPHSSKQKPQQQQQQQIVDVDTLNAVNFWTCRLTKKPSKWCREERSTKQRRDDKFKFGECTKDWKVSTESGSLTRRLTLASTLNKYVDNPPPGEYVPHDYVISKQEKFPSYTASGRNFAPVEELEQYRDLRGELEIIQSKTKTKSISPIRTSSRRPKTVPPRMPQPNPFITPTPGPYTIPDNINELTKFERPSSVKMIRSKSRQRTTLDFESLNINESLSDTKKNLPGPLTYDKSSFSKFIYKTPPSPTMSGRYTNPMYTKELIKPGPLDYDVCQVFEKRVLSPTSRLTKAMKNEIVIFKKEPLFTPKREHISLLHNTEKTLITKQLMGLNNYRPIIGPFYMKD